MLNENNAQHPTRINHKNPQNLAMEALEIHYRIYASVLKYLEQQESKSVRRSLALVFQYILKLCTQSGFISYDYRITDVLKDDGAENFPVCSQFAGIEERGFHHNTKQSMNNESILGTKKSSSCKRNFDETPITKDAKKLKANSLSHLQLMQDVVGLIDDLITDVCDKVHECSNSITRTIELQPDIEDTRSEGKKGTIKWMHDQEQVLCRNVCTKETDEMWLQNENLEPVSYKCEVLVIKNIEFSYRHPLDNFSKKHTCEKKLYMLMHSHMCSYAEKVHIDMIIYDYLWSSSMRPSIKWGDELVPRVLRILGNFRIS